MVNSGRPVTLYFDNQPDSAQARIPRLFDFAIRNAIRLGLRDAQHLQEPQANEDLQQAFSKVARGRATVSGLLAAYYFGLSFTVLDKPAEYSRGGYDSDRGQALRWASMSQQLLTEAFMWLPPSGRSQLIKAFYSFDIGLDLAWRRTCTGALAVARLAHALRALDAPLYFPEIEADVYWAIDLILGPIAGKTFAIQVKAARYQLLDATIMCDDPNNHVDTIGHLFYFKDMCDVWERMLTYNWFTPASCIPVFARVGMMGVPLSSLDHPNRNLMVSVKGFLETCKTVPNLDST